ncbi:MAG: family 20 glycosylhydrolase [Verrucomicrobia bacterium]|nr:family 20 glycosylhydrolase [Verrucomicrobiota bacterium]
MFVRCGRPVSWNVAMLTILITAPAAHAADSRAESLGLIPQPAQLEFRDGDWAFDRTSRIVARGVAETAANTLAEALSALLGWPVRVVNEAAQAGDIEMRLTPADARFGAEGYHLAITTRTAVIHAGTDAGLFYGGVTLRQLLSPQPPASGGAADAIRLPCLEIEDAPRFPWRGLLLDPARHFLPLPDLKKFVDVMALHKLNMLQLHLTDDQGWRLEIEQYPRLTEIGSQRKESPQPRNRDRGDGTPYGPFFYTQAEMRELVAYAQARHITLLPEIEMPGHFRAALAAYPVFSCTGGPFEVSTRWGVYPDILCAGNDDAVSFVCDVLAEVVSVFPSRFIHIGGDEAPRDRWKACTRCQARMKAEGLTNEAELQTWFNHRMEVALARHGRRLIGWDEILEGGLTPGAAVMSWRGMAGGLAAARAGHDVVMAPTSHCYFDYAQARGPDEPECIGGFIPLETVYGFEPVPAELAIDRQPHILGVQGNLWSEYLWNLRDVEYFAFPRASALAEVAWSPVPARDFASFQRRLERHLQRLGRLGVNYRHPTVGQGVSR